MKKLTPQHKQAIDGLAARHSAAEIARQLHLPERLVAAHLAERGASRRRKFYFAIMLMLPVVFVLLVEGLLQFLNYGGSLAAFIPAENAPGYLKINPNLGTRYFTNLKVAPEVSNDIFAAEKPADTYRIFVLGGSTAYGYPYGHNGSMSKFLLQRLQQAFPGRDFEVVNLAMPAVNTFTVLDLLDEVLAHEPDVLIFYTGHNEYYGALGAGSRESFGRSRTMTRLMLGLQNYRTLLFMRHRLADIAGWIRGNRAEASGATLMERMVGQSEIPFGSDIYQLGVDNFRENMRAIVERARRASVPVILATLSSNLADQPPFVSVTSADPGDATALRRQADQARAAMQEQRYEQAEALWRALTTADTLNADYAYAHARALLHLGKTEQAAAAFRRARDLDALRFRAPSVFNQLIRELAAESGAALADVAAAFEQASPENIPGNSLFLEHLHPNLSGYFLMAAAVARTLAEEVWQGPAWPEFSPRADSLLWQNRAVTPLDEEVARIRIGVLTSRWPFVRDRFASSFTYTPQNELQRIAWKLWKKELTWEQAHVQMAEFYTRQRQFAAAAREYEALILETPRNVSPYLRAGLSWLAHGSRKRAREILMRSLEIEKTPQAYKFIGAILLQEKNVFAAVNYLEVAARMLGNDAQVLYNLTGGYLMIGEVEKADSTLKAFEKLKPGSLEVATLRSDVLSLRRRQAEVRGRVQ